MLNHNKHKVHREGVGVILLGVALWAGAATASPLSLSRSVALESTDRSHYAATGLQDEPRLANQCRYRPDADLDVYADSALRQRLLTLRTPNTQVILTGVSGTGVAQIKDPALGWIATDHIEPCTITTTTTTTTTTTVVTPASSAATGSAPAPSAAPSPAPSPAPSSSSRAASAPAAQSPTACYRNLTNLTVRTGADDRYSQLGVYDSGATIYAADRPPQEQTSADGRIWMRVDAPNGTGWVARTAPNGAGSNLVRLADDQCNQ